MPEIVTPAAARRLIIVLAAIVMLAAAMGAAEAEQRAFDAINRERVERRLPPLIWDGQLARVARRHSERMRDLRFFSHRDPRFGNASERLTAAGVPWRACAENIYREEGYPDPVRSAVGSWLDSPGHRRNLLSPLYRRTGVGVAAGPAGEYFFTQVFTAR